MTLHAVIRQVFIAFSWIFIYPISVFGQINIDGFVFDAETKEAINGATVVLSKNKGTVTNNAGYFHLKWDNHTDTLLIVQFLGYETYTRKLESLNSGSNLVVYLKPGTQQLDNILINESIWQNDLLNTDIVSIPLEQVKNFPVLAGEADPIKYLQSLPGITPGREGRSDLHVRGGSPDQNLFLIDNMPVFTIQHMGGLLSILDPNSLKSIKLHKGGFPAKYGGRLSSVVDVQLKDGDKKTWKKYADLGLVASKFAIEGPLKKDTASTYLSLRRSNADLYTSLLSLASSGGQFRAGYTFYDFTGKVNYRPSHKDQLSVTLYGGLDRVFSVSRIKENFNDVAYNAKFKSGIDWTNLMGVLNWNHAGRGNQFRNVMVGFNRYQLNNGYHLERLSAATDTIVDYSRSRFNAFAWDFRAGLNYEVGLRENLTLHYGLQSSYQRFLPGIFIERQYGENMATINESYGAKTSELIEINAYMDAEYIWNKFVLNPGLRLSYWANVYDRPHLEPRLSVSYREEIHSVNFSFSNMQQSMHLLSNNSTGVPMDIWVPATQEAQPMQSSIYAVGYSRNTTKYLMQAGSYFKTYSNVIEFQEGKSFFGDQLAWDDKIVSDGVGKSYGFEFLLQKKTGRANGWLSYTYSRSLRKFDSINENEWFSYRYDRPHNASIFLNYTINKKISLGSYWMYASGDAITLPKSKYLINAYDQNNDYTLGYDFFPAYEYEKRNDFRVPATHRLDVNIAFVKHKIKSTRTFKMGIYNVYNRRNPYYVYLDESGGQLKLYKAALLPFFPFVAWNWTF
ncbi:MAG: carboxypeptidase-like regulatory domain-containing protein [Cyclobacteriaceae bacterium]